MKTYRPLVIMESIILLIFSISLIYMTFVFLESGNKDLKLFDNKINYLKDSNYNFKVFKPGEEFLNIFEDSELIDKMFPYNQKFININNERIALIYSNSSNLNITEFNNDLLIEEIKEDTDNYIYIDEKFKNEFNVNLGDEINVSFNGFGETMIITKVFESNNYYDEPVAYFNSDKYSILSTNDFDGIYLTSKDNGKLAEYLKNNYIPYGLMLSQSDFESQYEYEMYVENFKKEQLGSNIFNKDLSLKNEEQVYSYLKSNAINKQKNYVLIMSVIVFATIIKIVFGRSFLYNYESEHRVSLNKNNVLLIQRVFNIALIIIMYLIHLIKLKTTNNIAYFKKPFNILIIITIIILVVSESISRQLSKNKKK